MAERPRQREQHPDPQRVPRPPAEADHRAGDRARAQRRDQHAEYAGAAVDVLGDGRAERRTTARTRAARPTEKTTTVDPHPRALRGPRPALAQLGEHGCAARRPRRARAAGRAGGTRRRRGTSRRRGRTPSRRRARARARWRARGRRTPPRSRSCRSPRFASWISLLGHGLRQQAGVGGAEERLGGAEEGLDHHDVPDLDGAREDQRGQQRVQREARRGRWRSSPGGAAAGRPRRRRAGGSRRAGARAPRARARRRSASRSRSRRARARRTRSGRRSSTGSARGRGSGSPCGAAPSSGQSAAQPRSRRAPPRAPGRRGFEPAPVSRRASGRRPRRCPCPASPSGCRRRRSRR